MRLYAVILVALTTSTTFGADLLHTFHSPSLTANDGFGNAIAADENYIVIVNQGGDSNGLTNNGTGYVFDRNTYELVSQMDGTQEKAGFKHAQISNDEVYLGSWPGSVDDVYRAGFGAVYDVTTGDLKYVINNPTPAEDERFGSWAAPLGPGQWVVGGYKSDDQTPTGGVVFTFDDGVLNHTLFDPSVPAVGRADRFGYSVGTSDDYIVVGCYRDSEIQYGAGAVHVFDHDGNFIRSIDDPEINNIPHDIQDLFGVSLSTKGHYAAIGAHDGDDAVSGTAQVGSAFLYDLDTGEQLLRFDNPDLRLNRFGFKMAWLGDNIAVGTWNDPDDPYVYGDNGVYIFDGVTGELLESLSDPVGPGYNYFGFEIASAGTDLLVGSHVSPDDGKVGVGLTYLYSGDAWKPLVGDADHNGVIDGSDYLRWASNYGSNNVRGPADGDFNYDGTVDGADYLLWAGAYGTVTAVVPEPSTLVLAMLAVVGLLTTRKRGV